jgi:hypothetical protein
MLLWRNGLEKCRRIRGRNMHLLATARMRGHVVVYCLKTLAARTDVRMQRSLLGD